MITATTIEGRIVNLDYYESFNIEPHSVTEGQFQVKIHPSRNAASSNSATLHQGTKEECQAYVREVLSPLLGMDTGAPKFIEYYGAASKTTAKSNQKPAESESSPE